MSAGAEGAAGIDHDGHEARGRLLPGWADPQPADLDRAVKGAPLVLPARLDPLAGDVFKGRPERLLDLVVAVDRQLELPGKIAFLEAVRGELEQLRPRLLCPLERNAYGNAQQLDQWKTPFSRLKRPSSCS
jgi:hypothetical protein